MKKLIYSCLIYILGAFQLTAQTTIQETKLNSINGVLSLNNKPYNGHVVSIIFGGEIISSYDVIQGFIEGTVEEYFETPNYNASIYKDTSKINYWNLENKSQKNELLKIDSDSIKFTQELTDFINYKIGGQKKLEKLSSKNSEGKLKEKNKVLYDQYLQFEKNRSILSKQKMQLLNNNIALQIQIEKEINKPLYSPVIQTKYNMVKSVKSGFYKQYSPKGLTVTEGQYSNGKQEGLWTYNFPNGNIKAQGNFKNGDGRDTSDIGIPRNGREGKWTIYYENGKIKTDLSYLNYNLHGTIKFYYENGIIKDDRNYLDGKLTGLRKLYYENGKIKDEINYLNDKQHGTTKSYYENGKIKKEINYLNDKQHGTTKFYDNDGHLTDKANFNNGIMHGERIVYYENGNPKQIRTVNKGTEHGPSKAFYESGKLHYTGFIDSTITSDSKLIGEFIEYNEDGSIKSKVSIDKNGVIKELYKEKSKFDIEQEKAKKEIHECAWCGKKYKGFGWIIDRDMSIGDTPGACRAIAAQYYYNFGINTNCCSKKCALEGCDN